MKTALNFKSFIQVGLLEKQFVPQVRAMDPRVLISVIKKFWTFLNHLRTNYVMIVSITNGEGKDEHPVDFRAN